MQYVAIGMVAKVFGYMPCMPVVHIRTGCCALVLGGHSRFECRHLTAPMGIRQPKKYITPTGIRQPNTCICTDTNKLIWLLGVDESHVKASEPHFGDML